MAESAVSSIRARFPTGLRGALLSTDADYLRDVMTRFRGHPDIHLNIPVSQPEILPAVIESNVPDLLLVDASLIARESALSIGQRIAKQFPRLMVFLLAEDLSMAMHAQVMSAGMRGALPRRDFAPDALVRVITDYLTMVQGQESMIRESESRSGRDASAQYLQTASRLARTLAPKIVAVTSGKGGVGKSQVSVNLAMAAHSNPGGHTPAAIVDLERGMGAVTYLLNIARPVDLSAWMPYMGHGSVLDPETVLRSLVVTHQASGLHAVPSAPTRDDYDSLDAAAVELCFNSLRNMHAVTVADLPPTVTGPAVVALQLADVIVVVTELDIAAVMKTKDYLVDIMGPDIGIDASKIWVVYNRVPAAERKVRVEDGNAVLQPLGVTFAPVRLPEDGAVGMSRGTDESVTIRAFPDAPWSRAMRALTASILPGIGLEMAVARGRDSGGGSSKRRRFLGLF